MEWFCNVTSSKQANKIHGTGTPWGIGTQLRQPKGACTEAQHLPADTTHNVKSLGRDKIISTQKVYYLFLVMYSGGYLLQCIYRTQSLHYLSFRTEYAILNWKINSSAEHNHECHSNEPGMNHFCVPSLFSFEMTVMNENPFLLLKMISSVKLRNMSKHYWPWFTNSPNRHKNMKQLLEERYWMDLSP